MCSCGVEKHGQAKDAINKSEEIRQLLKANPTISASDAIAALGKTGIKVHKNLFYYIKGRLKGRKGQKKGVRQVVDKATEVASTGAKIAESTYISEIDALAMILKVKTFAAEVGGLSQLKDLVDALSE